MTSSPMTASTGDSPPQSESMSNVTLNWLDKTVWALAIQTGDKHPYNVIAMTWIMAMCLGMFIAFLYRLLWKVLGVIDFSLPADYWFGLLVFALCYIPVHFATHPASEIVKTDLSRRERRIYTALGFLICPISWGSSALSWSGW